MNKIATFFRETSIGRFFIPVGIILIVFSILVFMSVDKSKNYIKTDAVVTKTELYEEAYTDEEGNYNEATYNVFVKYTVDGTEYEEEYGISTGYKKGDKVTIYYNPKNPKQITGSKNVILPIIILSVGIAFLIGGIVSIIRSLKRHKEMKLQEEGWKNE